METSRKVTLNLPNEQIAFLQALAQKESISVTDVIRRAINSEKFFVDKENNGSKILIEEGNQIREVIRR